MDNIIRVFIGHDSKAPHHTEVCKQSILRHATKPVLIETLDQDALRRASLYRRWFYRDSDDALVDGADGRPFSSEFAFTRFMIPALMQWKGSAIFCDSDFMFRDDINKLWHEHDERYAVQVAQQKYISKAKTKKTGVPQQNYNRKNWSSLILWNCGHQANRELTTHVVNTFPGSYLHGFGWLRAGEIGTIRHGWNWIEGTTSSSASAVHFTLGTPDLEAYRNMKFADEWRAYLD